MTSDVLIFALGVIVTMITLTAVILVGRSEGADPALNRERAGSRNLGGP